MKGRRDYTRQKREPGKKREPGGGHTASTLLTDIAKIPCTMKKNIAEIKNPWHKHLQYVQIYMFCIGTLAIFSFFAHF